MYFAILALCLLSNLHFELYNVLIAIVNIVSTICFLHFMFVNFAMSTLQSARCNLPYALYMMLFSSSLFAFCNMQNTICILLVAFDTLQLVLYKLKFTICIMYILYYSFCSILHNVLCILHCAFCNVYCACCCLQYAFCTLLFVFDNMHIASCILHLAYSSLHLHFCTLQVSNCFLQHHNIYIIFFCSIQVATYIQHFASHFWHLCILTFTNMNLALCIMYCAFDPQNVFCILQ